MSVYSNLLVFAILVGVAGLAVGGCGCREGGVEEVPMSLVPSEVDTGQEVVVLTQFEEDVFLGGRVDVRAIHISIEDATGALVGWLSYQKAVFDWEEEDSLTVDGVVLDGMVVDSTAFELLLSFDESMSTETLTVTVGADDAGVECFALDSGTATLTVM